MKLNSISGITCYVKDVQKTADFYETLGFRLGKHDERHVTCYVNWFWVDCIAQDQETDPELQKEANAVSKGGGVLLAVKVDSIDEYYQSVLAAGLKPLGEPQVRPSGNREFTLLDPDGYKLTFFEKK